MNGSATDSKMYFTSGTCLDSHIVVNAHYVATVAGGKIVCRNGRLDAEGVSTLNVIGESYHTI